MNTVPPDPPPPPEGDDQTPELVKRMSASFAQIAGTSHPRLGLDSLLITRIYADFKWRLKTANRSWQEIDELLASAIHRCEQEIQTPELRAKAITAFSQMRNKASEHAVSVPDPEPEPDLCPKCHLHRFICPCPRETT